MRFTAGRNQRGLTEKQIAYCVKVWAVLCADQPIALETSEALQYASRTRFNEVQNAVFLGADAWPGDGIDANARLSTLACLAHELAHAERFQMGYVAQQTSRTCYSMKPRQACGRHSRRSSARRIVKTLSKMRGTA
jgi:hypothetical protein